MSFWKKLFSGKSKGWQAETAEALFLFSQCDQCQEKFRNRIDKRFDLQMNYSDSGPAYRTHKELIGARCRNKVIIDLEFDQRKHLLNKSIENGRFISREEYDDEQEAEQI